MKMQNSIKSVSAAKRKEQKQTLEFQRIILTVGNIVSWKTKMTFVLTILQR